MSTSDKREAARPYPKGVESPAGLRRPRKEMSRATLSSLFRGRAVAPCNRLPVRRAPNGRATRAESPCHGRGGGGAVAARPADRVNSLYEAHGFRLVVAGRICGPAARLGLDPPSQVACRKLTRPACCRSRSLAELAIEPARARPRAGIVRHRAATFSDPRPESRQVSAARWVGLITACSECPPIAGHGRRDHAVSTCEREAAAQPDLRKDVTPRPGRRSPRRKDRVLRSQPMRLHRQEHRYPIQNTEPAGRSAGGRTVPLRVRWVGLRSALPGALPARVSDAACTRAVVTEGDQVTVLIKATEVMLGK